MESILPPPSDEPEESPPPEETPPAKGLLLRRAVLGGLAAVALGVGYSAWRKALQFPADTTPEGAYLRVAQAITLGDPKACFAYLEDAAQHAAYTIRDYRKRASDRVAAAYPEPEKARLLSLYKKHAEAEDGADVWAEMATRLGWVGRLRKDLSGIVKTEIQGERASIETAHGTRYAFRRRPNGIWGLTMFTAELLSEAERAARDYEVVDKAASDYERGR
jgi:hypothetical protein